MKALFYQPSCGIAGDINLAAMIDLGVPESHLRSELDKLMINHDFQLVVEPSSKQGIHGTMVTIKANEGKVHRNLSDVTKIIEQAKFSRSVEAKSLAVFDSLAHAEGKIHSINPNKIHFHEVGAIDSIVDIVGAAICLDYLGVNKILSNPIEVGSGFVDCDHGRFPVPAPATQELLKDAPCRYGGVTGESTTPTGAAILHSFVDEFEPRGVFVPKEIGYGIGHKDFELPNVLCVTAGKYTQLEPRILKHVKIEANIDDMTPEAFDPLIKTLFKTGASDVYLNPIMMKKSRPAQCLVVLCEALKSEKISETILNNSSTIGLRIIPFEKVVLPREESTIRTTMGNVRIKKVTQPDGQTRWKSEHDDIAMIAQNSNENYHSIKQKIDAEISLLLSQKI